MEMTDRRFEGLSEKVYLTMDPPSEEDARSGQQRILDALRNKGAEAKFTLSALRGIYPLCEEAGWNITVSLSFSGEGWRIVQLEKGDTTERHFGYAVDLGSTTVVVRLIDCKRGRVLAEESCFNRQIAQGEDILNRIFFSRNDPQKLDEIRQEAVDSILECLRSIEQKTGVHPEDCISMAVSGNSTMIHFLLGLDAFCVFYTPWALHADRPDFIAARELGFPLRGYVYIFPSKSNYLGGDIISGLIDTGIHKSKDIDVFFDIGTNGELVIGNREFLLCGAGAAGPALEGGSVRTGMRAGEGAVDSVKIEDGRIKVHVIGETEAKGICGSGIIELIAGLFLEGWIDIRGNLMEGKSPLIAKMDGSLAVEYAPGLYFRQEDIEELIRTKAAAHTMVEIMMQESGISPDQISRFYVAGSFGKYVSKQAAITIGMYPDMDPEKIVQCGNTSLSGAQKVLLNRSLIGEIDGILDKMVYLQFGSVENFPERMKAAQALPHTDFDQYPSVMRELKERRTKRGESKNF